MSTKLFNTTDIAVEIYNNVIKLFLEELIELIEQLPESNDDFTPQDIQNIQNLINKYAKKLNLQYSHIINFPLEFKFMYDTSPYADPAWVDMLRRKKIIIYYNIAELVKCYTENNIENIIDNISHELTHAFDIVFKYTTVYQKKSNVVDLSYKKHQSKVRKQKYYNIDEEVRAYAAGIATSIIYRVKKHGKLPRPKGYQEFIEQLSSISVVFKNLVKPRLKKNNNVDEILTDKNKKILLQLIYNTLDQMSVWE